METSFKITLSILATVILLAFIGIGLYMQLNPSQTVDVEGIANVKANPDLISVYFEVETIENSSKEVKDRNSEIVDKVITSLIKLGLERDDITTENFNIYPDYEYDNGKRELTGYKASHRLKVELDSDSDMIGEVIDAGVDSGASINYINFELSQDKKNDLMTEALEKATQGAREKAEGIAKGLGKEVGSVVSVSSQEFNYHPWRLYESSAGNSESAKQAVTDIQPGEKEVTGRVKVVYALR